MDAAKEDNRPYVAAWADAFTDRRARSSRGAPFPVRGDNGGMEILLNGESRELAVATTLDELLRVEGLFARRVAVEVNGSIVPRTAHSELRLQAGDRVEIVHALGGG
jgi:sulfur carrier protein